MEKKVYLFTSESVSEGHPDKLADQVSDAVLDACLMKDPESRVACETFTTTGMVLVGGELSTETYVDIQEVVRGVTKKIGYTRPEYGLDYESMAVINALHSQSPDIAQGVTTGQGLFKEQGAGDQGMMFGYACRESEELMPAPIIFSHKLLMEAAEIRRAKTLGWLRPDAKSQVTVEYEGHTPRRIDTVVLSHQHDEDVRYEDLKDSIIEKIINRCWNLRGFLRRRPSTSSTPPEGSLSAGPTETRGSPAEKSSLIPTAAWGAMEGGPSAARILPR